MLPAWLNALYIALLALGCVASAAFVVRYTTRYRWWRTAIGAHLVGMSSCLSLLFVYVLLTRIFGPLPGRVVIATFILASLSALQVWRLLIFENFGKKRNKTDDQA